MATQGKAMITEDKPAAAISLAVHVNSMIVFRELRSAVKQAEYNLTDFLLGNATALDELDIETRRMRTAVESIEKMAAGLRDSIEDEQEDHDERESCT